MIDLLPWITLVMALGVAALSMYEYWITATASASDAGDAETMNNSITSLHQRLRGIAGALQTAGGASPRRAHVSAVPVSSPSRPAAPPPPPEPVRDSSSIEAILEAADGWWSPIAPLGMTRPQTFSSPYKRLRVLADGLDPIDPDKVSRDGRAIAQAALLFSDKHRLFDERAVQSGLNVLLKTVGLTVVSPRVGERYDPVVHEAVGRDPAPAQQNRGHISEVVQRGLQDGRTIITKAEVRVYD
jgi:hypothetical protein